MGGISAFAVGQAHLSPPEILGAVLLGLLALGLILVLFRRRKGGPSAPPPPAMDTPLVSDGPLSPIITSAAHKIVALARTKVASAGIFHIGAVDIHPRYLAYWITAATDAERDRLKADQSLQDEARRILLRAGYPADAVLEVGFAFESQETCDRDYGGNWWYVVK